ncbi:hypothetical protein AMS68_001702 [Peltaster fructicola]|uniref:Small ribosomal subunit protein uS9m n=1 Tax=Peltaster fructicola TaxID=286661 RepID=A0A6H0XNH0_9PEZI|nr:hypothetical protein AMS68_001702 [Peltaster fructicola]
MEAPLLRTSCKRALAARTASVAKPGCRQQQRRWLATPTDTQEPIRAAAPIRFNSDRNQFARRNADVDERGRSHRLLERVRVVPASPSYFTATPQYTDDLLHLTALLRKYQHIPVCAPGQAPQIAWKTYDQYTSEISEVVKQTRFSRLVGLIKRLNSIHPPLVPADVAQALLKFRRTLQPFMNKPNPVVVDKWGRARAVGKRKSSRAQCFVVEGDGQVLINGQSLTEYFGRVHDRESVVWALKATQRMDKYNIWAVVRGGGTTGQAEALMLGVARALLVHEPDLKPALRRAGVVTRDPRRVERKKPGHIKARKMPTWVKR